MSNKEVLILGWHQVYLSSNAGGYVRLKEFLKRAPKSLNITLLDNTPTIYNDVFSKKNIVTYDTPQILKRIRPHFFLFWLFLETVATGFVIYNTARNIIREKKVSVLYVPIGEFPQLYIPALFLKKAFPEIRLLVDILNYEIPDVGPLDFFKKMLHNGMGIFRSIVTIIMFYLGYWVTNLTLKNVDYIFTVSPDLVKKIKKAYKKSSIDYTPSGVDNNFSLNKKNKKVYLGVYLGRITLQKGVFELLATWENVIKVRNDAKLAIMGSIDDKNKKALLHEIKKKKLQKQICLFYNVSEKEKKDILSKSELFLHLAVYEPLFPVIGILEGLSFGLPVLVYDMPVISSQKEAIRNQKCIIVIKNSDNRKVADTAISYTKLDVLAKQKLTNSAKEYANHYDWNIIAKKEFSVIEKLVNTSS